MKVDCQTCGVERKKFNNWNSDGPICRAYRKVMGIKFDLSSKPWTILLEGCWHPVGTIHVFGEQDEC